MMRLLRKWRRDESGLSAIEFALLAPIMIFFYFALVEFCQGYMAQKRMGHVAAQVADMVAQSDEVTSTQVDDIFMIGDLIMRPFSAAPLSIQVSSVTRDKNGVAKVDWSRAKNTTALEKNAVVDDVPTDLIGNNESIVMAVAEYRYETPAAYVMPGVTKFSQTYYLRPRTVNTVIYKN